MFLPFQISTRISTRITSGSAAAVNTSVRSAGRQSENHWASSVNETNTGLKHPGHRVPEASGERSRVNLAPSGSTGDRGTIVSTFLNDLGFKFGAGKQTGVACDRFDRRKHGVHKLARAHFRSAQACVQYDFTERLRSNASTSGQRSRT